MVSIGALPPHMPRVTDHVCCRVRCRVCASSRVCVSCASIHGSCACAMERDGACFETRARVEMIAGEPTPTMSDLMIQKQNSKCGRPPDPVLAVPEGAGFRLDR